MLQSGSGIARNKQVSRSSSHSWLVSARHRLTWCDVLLRFAPLLLLLLLPLPLLLFVTLLLLLYTWWPWWPWCCCCLWCRESSSSESDIVAVLYSPSPWTVAKDASGLLSWWRPHMMIAGDDGRLQRSSEFLDASSSLSSSSSSRLQLSSCVSWRWSLDRDVMASSPSSSALARLYLVRRFWNQTLTCNHAAYSKLLVDHKHSDGCKTIQCYDMFYLN